MPDIPLQATHKWSDEKAKKVKQTHGLRKDYVWKEKPIRKKKKKVQPKEDVSKYGESKKTEKKPEKQYFHKKKWCTVEGCLTVTKTIARHISMQHKKLNSRR